MWIFSLFRVTFVNLYKKGNSKREIKYYIWVARMRLWVQTLQMSKTVPHLYIPFHRTRKKRRFHRDCHRSVRWDTEQCWPQMWTRDKQVSSYRSGGIRQLTLTTQFRGQCPRTCQSQSKLAQPKFLLKCKGKKEMNSWIGPTIKQLLELCHLCVKYFFGFNIKTTAFCLGQYSLHLLLLKSSMVRDNFYVRKLFGHYAITEWDRK